MKKLFYSFFIMILLVIFQSASVYAAFDPKDYPALGIYFVGDKCDANSQAPVTEGQTSGGSSGPVYMMGDSTVEGAKQDLIKEFESAKVEVSNIDGVVSRSFVSKGEGTTNGLQAIDKGEANIKRSNTVIIGLGTNGEDAPGKSTTFEKNAEKAVSKIKTVNSKAKIYWINIFSDSPPITQKGDYNDVIKNLSGVSVIDMNKENISLSQDRTHPDARGNKKYAKVVADAISATSGGGSRSDGVEFDAGMSIDTDGTGAHHGDGTSQGDTSLHNGNSALNADTTSFIALAPGWASAHGLTLGDVASVKYKGKTAYAVYGDNYKGDQVHGEGSYHLAESLGINSNPNTGGTDSGVHYIVYPSSHKQLGDTFDQRKIDQIASSMAGTTDTAKVGQSSPQCACPSAGAGGAFSGSASSRIGYGMSSKGQENLQKAVVQAGEKFDVDANFIAAFYYAENSRTGDSTNNADSANGSPTTGDGKWREPAPPEGSGPAWDPPNSATAYGPFQFITTTWQSYKPSGANDTSDRLDLFKEAMAAGKYLAASGAKGKTDDASLLRAAFAYNQSDTYGQSVLNTYKYISGHGSKTVSGDGVTEQGCNLAGPTASGDIPSGSAAELAKKLLDLKAAGKYNCDNPGDCQDLLNVSKNQPIGGQCGVDSLDPKVLKMIIYMINNGFKIGTFALCGDHRDDGPNGHHGGKAVDISSVNGVSVNSPSGKKETLKAAIFINKLDGELRVRQLITDGYGDKHDQDLTNLTVYRANGTSIEGQAAADIYKPDTMADHRDHIHAGY